MSYDFSYTERRRDYGFKPVKLNGEYEVTIQDVSRRGEGVARIKGFIVFVPNARVGEKLRVRITRLGSRYAVAERV